MSWIDSFNDEELEKIAGYYANPRKAQIESKINNLANNNKNPNGVRKVINNELSKKGITSRNTTKSMSIDAVGNQNQGGVNAAINRGQIPAGDNRLHDSMPLDKTVQRAAIDKEVADSYRRAKGSPWKGIASGAGVAGALGALGAGVYGMGELQDHFAPPHVDYDAGYDANGAPVTPWQAGVDNEHINLQEWHNRDMANNSEYGNSVNFLNNPRNAAIAAGLGAGAVGYGLGGRGRSKRAALVGRPDQEKIASMMRGRNIAMGVLGAAALGAGIYGAKALYDHFQGAPGYAEDAGYDPNGPSATLPMYAKSNGVPEYAEDAGYNPNGPSATLPMYAKSNGVPGYAEDAGYNPNGPSTVLRKY